MLLIVVLDLLVSSASQLNKGFQGNNCRSLLLVIARC